MIAARCSICQSGKNVPWNWWQTCPHDKYVTVRPVETVRPLYEEEKDTEGHPTGRKVITGTEKLVEWVPMPNWKEVALSPRLNQGRGYHRNRRRGSILPEELITETWPGGGKPVCQFRGCYETEGLVEYRTGVFHSEREAQLVWYDQEGKVLEYNNEVDPESQAKRGQMLAGAHI
jgi:hypothetical protein